MFAVDRLLLVAAALVMVGVLSSKFAARIGVPVLVLFVAVGMLAGSEGLGGIAFDDHTLAQGVATVALAVILFDGGLRTPVNAFRIAVAPALSLATVGVLLTALITGLAAAWLLDIPLLQGLLLGSIISSTDAAAVFAVLRSSGIHIRKRLASILEVESGSNDPMAVFLTVACIELLLGRLRPGIGVLGFFIMQMGLGAVIGVITGRLAVWLINRINLQAAGLYPLMTGASGMLAYGLAATVGGSGFLAVYLAGIIMGNANLVFRRGTLLFHDAAAWLSQIAMFVMLGLLSFPSQLMDVAPVGILLAATLIFVARPVAVWLTLLPFRVHWREMTFISWVGLKGAVPIVLATYPLLAGLDFGGMIFDIVFFVVMISVVTQGWSLPPVARALRLQLPPRAVPPVSLDITSLRDVDADIVEYTLPNGARAVGRTLRDLHLPENAVVAMISRGERIIPPRGSTRLNADDHVFVVLQPRARPMVDRVFSVYSEAAEIPPLVEFPMDALTTTVHDLHEYYGVKLHGDERATLAEYLESALGPEPEIGAELRDIDIHLRVLEVENGRPIRVGLRINP
jgi:potassium/hydrogen antiporter